MGFFEFLTKKVDAKPKKEKKTEELEETNEQKSLIGSKFWNQFR